MQEETGQKETQVTEHGCTCDDLRQRVDRLEKDFESARAPVIHVDQVDGDVAGGGIAKIDDRWILWLAALMAVIVAAWALKKIIE